MEPAIFAIDRTKRGGQALYELLRDSAYARLIQQNKTRRGKIITEHIPNAATKKSIENIKNGENLTVCKDREDFWQKVLS